MAINYDDFKVIETHPELGQITVAWYDSQSATPIPQQPTMIVSHVIPQEAEDNSWTRTQLRDFWISQVPDVPAIPAWADAEAGQFFVLTKSRLRQTQ